MFKLCFAAAAALVLFSPTLQAQDQKPKTRALYEQSQQGVTVRLEKIAVQSTLVNPADAPQNLRQRSVAFFLSFSNCGNNFGPFEITYANDNRPHRSELIGMWPPRWVPHVKGTDVDPQAIGYEFKQYITGDFAVDALFPLTVTVNAETKTGEKVKFTFKNVRF